MSENTIPNTDLRKLLSQKKPSVTRIPCLVIFGSDHIEKIHPLHYPVEKNSIVIGRGQQSDIILSQEGVSRQHARIDKHENSYIIVDLHSLNGTLLNNEPISQAILKEGDKVGIGEATFRFCLLSEFQIEFEEVHKTKVVNDHLTNIATKPFFLEMLRKETSFAFRQNQPLSCIILDIDHLHTINEEYGDAAGDLVLQEVASFLNEGLRSYDVLCRYGGEEFAILLRGTALDNAMVFCERIRKRIELLKIPFEGREINITLSLGISSLNPDYIQDSMDLLREADRHLQTAKKHGGNQVCSQRSKL
ncbi:MAG: diguanylate cyclase [Bdellovibrionales bacterium]|nr:diguanylate cyclase [Bdellovibrionales bacterium]